MGTGRAADETAVHVVRRGDLDSPAFRPPWEDPGGFAELGPEKRASLLANPSCDREDMPVQLIGTSRGRAVGRLDLVAGHALVDGARAPVLWTSALSVEPEARGTLLGVSLVLRMQRLSPSCMACGVSQQALPVFRKLKWIDLELPRYLRLRRSRSVCARLPVELPRVRVLAPRLPRLGTDQTSGLGVGAAGAPGPWMARIVRELRSVAPG